MLVVLYATIVLLTVAISGNTIIKDNPAFATDGNGKKIPVSGEKDTIQVFDIHPAGENYTEPGLSMDINVTPLNETEGGLNHPPVTTKYPSPTLSQVTSFTLPSDYSKINYDLPPTTAFDDEAVSPIATPNKVEQNPKNPAMVPPAFHLATPAKITPMHDHWNKSTPSFYPFTNLFRNLPQTQPTVKPTVDPLAPAFGQNLNPSLVSLFNFGANQNPFSSFPFDNFSNLGNSTFPTGQNQSPFNLPHTTSLTPENPFNISSTHSFPPIFNPFVLNTNLPAENPFNISSFLANPFFPENLFKPTAKPPADYPFNQFTPTLPQNILPFDRSLFNKENSLSTGGFPTATSPNPFLPNFDSASKPLFSGKPSRVIGPNPDESNVVIVPRSADNYNETALYSDHKSDSLLGKLFNMFGSNKNSSDPKIVDYNAQISPAANSSTPIDYSDMMAMAPTNLRSTDYINPSIYKSYFNPTTWNKFTNITDFDDSNSLGNPNNPFAAFNPSASPLAFMQNINPWSPGNVNNPWNPNNFNQVLLNLTSMMKTPTSSFGAGFNFPSFGAGRQPWNVNTTTPGLMEMFRNGDSPAFNFASLKNTPRAFSANDAANTTNKPLPMLQMPQMNLLAGLPGMMNISDLMKNVKDSINLLTGNSSQALLLKSLMGGAENPMNWPPAAFPHNPPKLAPAPFPSPAASFGTADAPDTRRLSDVYKSVQELPIPQPKKAPIEIETIPATSVLLDERWELYGDEPKVAKDNGVTAGVVLVNGTSVTKVPPNGALVILSSWVMVIGIVVGVIAQKLCN